MPIQFRFATSADSEQIAEIYRPIVTDTAISFEFEPPNAAEMTERIHKKLEQYPWLVCTVDDVIAGYVYAGRLRGRAAYQWSTEVTAYVHAAYRGRQIASALYETLFDLLVLQGYCMAFAGVVVPNPASVRLHERVGFKQIGVYHHIGYKHGQWHDVSWWERQLQPLASPPVELQPIQAIASSAAVQAALESGARRVGA